MTTINARIDLHQAITGRILAEIEQGDAGTFRMPWSQAGGSGLPVNIASGKRYNGINVLSLWVAALERGYSRPIWSTYKQWQAHGCQVRKGEKASLVVFYKTITVDTETDSEEETTERLIARASAVFNADQVDGFTPAEELPTVPLFEPIAAADAFARQVGATIQEGGCKACYAVAEDVVMMPDRVRFQGTATMSAGEAYYATLMHELTHWTAHPDRCGRDLKHRFGSEAYAMEELVAELGAAFLCAELGITPEPRADHAQYITHWLGVLKADKKAIFTAASKAQGAVDYLREKAKISPGL